MTGGTVIDLPLVRESTRLWLSDVINRAQASTKSAAKGRGKTGDCAIGSGHMELDLGKVGYDWE